MMLEDRLAILERDGAITPWTESLVNGALFGKSCRSKRGAAACLTMTDRSTVPREIGQLLHLQVSQ